MSIIRNKLRNIKRLLIVDKLRLTRDFFVCFGFGMEQLNIVSKYLFNKLFSEHSDSKHLEAAMEWLAYAQDYNISDAGVSNMFSLKNGFGVSYPETSGYILSTFIIYAEYSKDKSYIKRAIDIGDWEIDIQTDNGGVLSSPEAKLTRVFNTGQVILGWCHLFEYTKDGKYLKAAKKSGDYLLNLQEENGSWIDDTYCGARTYHARVAWSLLRLYQLSKKIEYRGAAVRNLKWVLSQQTENGWFNNCGFDHSLPIMHVIVYTLRGLLECALTGDKEINKLNIMPILINSANAICNALKNQLVNDIKGMVPSAFDENWIGSKRDSNLTGNAQFVCFLYLLSYFVDDNKRYIKTANEIMSATKRTQLLDTSLKQANGAIAGSYPFYSSYVNGYPNWATKFFADALLMKINYNKKLQIPA